jgi:hypothetical protein
MKKHVVRNEADRLWASTPQNGGVFAWVFLQVCGENIKYQVHLNEPHLLPV